MGEINTIETINDSIDTVIDCVIDISKKQKNHTTKDSILCECGGHYVARNRTRHIKSAKHPNHYNKDAISLDKKPEVKLKKGQRTPKELTVALDEGIKQ